MKHSVGNANCRVPHPSRAVTRRVGAFLAHPSLVDRRLPCKLTTAYRAPPVLRVQTVALHHLLLQFIPGGVSFEIGALRGERA